MRVEFAEVCTSKYGGGVKIGEIVHLGDVSAGGGDLTFSDGVIEIRKTDSGVNVDLKGLKTAGLFAWRHLRRSREIGLQKKDGGGCAQIDQKWMVVVHEYGTSGIYERLGKKIHGGYHNESYWHT